MADVLQRLQRWYLGSCDGEWEHSYGVSIGTLDNPGWMIRIDIPGTGLDGGAFDPVDVHRTDDDWVVARIEEDCWCAYCGPSNLGEAIEVFLGWVDSGASS